MKSESSAFEKAVKQLEDIIAPIRPKRNVKRINLL